MGTFSKSLAIHRRFLLLLIKMQLTTSKHNSRSLIFSASMTPSSAASVFGSNRNYGKTSLNESSISWISQFMPVKDLKRWVSTQEKSESPIIPLFIRDDIKALKMSQILLDKGIFVNPVVSPAVPKEKLSYPVFH